jgi:branched-chain amino acid transport system substrate-binding protein
MRIKRYSLLVVLAPLLALSACAPSEPIHIGYLGALSGRGSDLGTGGLNGTRLAIELRNNAGGIKGRPLELIEADDQQDPETARKALDRLIAHRVAAVIGPMTSAMAMATVAQINQEKLVMLSPTVTSGDLSGLDDYFFRVIPATRHFVKTNADYYFHTLGLRRLRLVYDVRNKSYSESWLDEFSKTFLAMGGSLLPPISFASSDETHFPQLATRALAGNPQAIIIVGNSVDAAMLCQSLRRSNAKVAIGTSEWAATERLPLLGGKAAEGITVAQFFDRESNAPDYQAFKQAYQKRFSREPGFAELLAFDAANVIFDALAAQGPKQTLKQVILSQKTFRGSFAPIRFDAYGDTAGKTFMATIRNGHFVSLPPPDTSVPSVPSVPSVN